MPKIDVLAHVKRTGFIWGPEPEIYGGFAGFYTYGPLGKLLKNNVENKIRNIFIKNGFWEIEAPIIMPEVVWKASGHLERFTDPVVTCSKCKSSFRASKLIEEDHRVSADAFTEKQLLKFIKKHNVKCANCKSKLANKIEYFNLMMKTHIGQNDVAFNRPETATTTYLPFKNYYDFFRRKMPLKIFQIGKAFRNEISPRQNVIRGREFTQAEAQLFIFKENKNKFSEYNKINKFKIPLWPAEFQKLNKKYNKFTLDHAVRKKWIQNKAYAWCLAVVYQFISSLGIPDNKIRFRQHSKEEMSHYAADAWDLEINLNTYGWVELVGVHDRQQYDLKQHAKHSGQDISVEGKYPHILEMAFGSDRPVFALLDLFLKSEAVHGRERVVLKLPLDLAPVQVAVFPLVNKDKLPEKAERIHSHLRRVLPSVHVIYDEVGSIGRRYRRMDQIGTPYCITVDYTTLDDETVTVRERDSMKQSRIKISDLAKKLKL